MQHGCQGFFLDTDMHLDHPIPILRIFSIPLAESFYLDFLGFEKRWEHRFDSGLPLYMEIARDNLILHLSEHYGDGTPGSAVFLPMQGIHEFQQTLIAQQASFARPGVEKASWGFTMNISDPFGNHLRFCERRHEHS